MQINLPHKLYTNSRVSESEYSQEAYERLKRLEFYKKLRAEGCKENTALEAISVSRATYYRWRTNYNGSGISGLEVASKRPYNLRKPCWDNSLKSSVTKLRKQFPLWGKNKIAAVLQRDYGYNVSSSTVGRIISVLIQNGAVQPAFFYYGNSRRKQPRNFKNHAQRWKYGMKSSSPGELVQIDHMTIELNDNAVVKHFKAICPITKIVVEQAYTKATSYIAAQFLDYVQEQMPFSVRSIQVDGGSEFMLHFEDACKAKEIPLYVLPPRSPKYNAHVERGNSTVKYEFYYLYDGPTKLAAIRSSLREFVHLYNTFRPHQALQYQTPWQYYSSMEPQMSHMY